MKRIFIAVGSAGTIALKELIHRLHDENMFDKFNDYYIAFDSDACHVEEFIVVRDSLQSDRILGYRVTISPEDSAVMSFNSDWKWEHMCPGGVGGDRRMSRKAAACIRNVWNDPSLGLDANLQPDDHIIVVGSAFGGTSSGMFLNVCQYLDYRIREKRQANDLYGQTQILGFLLMPEGVADQRYPAATNMIDMFRNLQTASWQRRLESSRPGFKVPTLIQYDKNDGYFKLYSGTQTLSSYGIVGSTLPMSALYLVPPPQEMQYTSAVYAETLFAASYLRICEGHSRWVARLHNPMNPVATQVTAEDINIQGLWIGTLGIGFNVRESICNIYADTRDIFPIWSSDAQGLRRVMTTVEMLKFGLIIEAIEEKFNEAWEARKANPDHLDDTILNCSDLLQISFSDSEGNKFSLTADTPHVLGFEDDRGLAKIRIEWIREIMGWLRSTDGSSFNAFFPGATFDSVRNTEDDIFNNMRFSIKAEEIAEMDALKNDLLKSLQISGI